MNLLGAVATCLLFLSGCALADSDRCSGGLVWDEKVKLCHPGTETDGDTASETDSTDSGENDTSLDAGDGTAVTFGTPCTDDVSCTGEVDLCLKNPLAPNDPGICTLENCTADDCPDTFLCCDCGSLGAEIACMPEAEAGTAEMFGCSCS